MSGLSAIFRTGGGAFLSILDRLKRFGFLRLLSIFFVFRVFVPTIRLAFETSNVSLIFGDIAFRLATSTHQAIGFIDILKNTPNIGLMQYIGLVGSILGSFVLFYWLILLGNWIQLKFHGIMIKDSIGAPIISIVGLFILEFSALAIDSGTLFSFKNIPGQGLFALITNIGVIFSPILNLFSIGSPKESVANMTGNITENMEKSHGLLGTIRELIF